MRVVQTPSSPLPPLRLLMSQPWQSNPCQSPLDATRSSSCSSGGTSQSAANPFPYTGPSLCVPPPARLHPPLARMQKRNASPSPRTDRDPTPPPQRATFTSSLGVRIHTPHSSCAGLSLRRIWCLTGVGRMWWGGCAPERCPRSSAR